MAVCVGGACLDAGGGAKGPTEDERHPEDALGAAEDGKLAPPHARRHNPHCRSAPPVGGPAQGGGEVERGEGPDAARCDVRERPTRPARRARGEREAAQELDPRHGGGERPRRGPAHTVAVEERSGEAQHEGQRADAVHDRGARSGEQRGAGEALRLEKLRQLREPDARGEAQCQARCVVASPARRLLVVLCAVLLMVLWLLLVVLLVLV